MELKRTVGHWHGAGGQIGGECCWQCAGGLLDSHGRQCRVVITTGANGKGSEKPLRGSFLAAILQSARLPISKHVARRPYRRMRARVTELGRSLLIAPEHV